MQSVSTAGMVACIVYQQSSIFPYYTETHGTITLEKLVETYSMSSKQLNCNLKERDITHLAYHFDSVELYLGVFELTAAEKADLKATAYLHGTQTAMSKCLSFWRSHNPSAATLRALLEILLSIGKEHIASKICNYYFQK